jgi:hypothetical protein
VGTSPFTHKDDQTAPIHTTHGPHQEAHLFGVEHDGDEKAEIILGPGPFGSPDPATLGHRMNPLEPRPASAPKLDDKFHELQGTNFYTADELQGLTKAELFELAQEHGLKLKTSATREDILNQLLNNPESEDDDDDDDGKGVK